MQQQHAPQCNGTSNGNSISAVALQLLVSKLEQNLKSEQRAYCQQHHMVFRQLLSHTQVHISLNQAPSCGQSPRCHAATCMWHAHATATPDATGPLCESLLNMASCYVLLTADLCW